VQPATKTPDFKEKGERTSKRKGRMCDETWNKDRVTPFSYGKIASEKNPEGREKSLAMEEVGSGNQPGRERGKYIPWKRYELSKTSHRIDASSSTYLDE